MILEICLSTRADRNISCDHFYVSPEDVKKGVRVDYILPSQYREYVKSIYVKACGDGEHVKVVSKYGSQQYPAKYEVLPNSFPWSSHRALSLRSPHRALPATHPNALAGTERK